MAAKYHALHPWQLSATEAIQLQKQMATQVISSDQFTQVNYVAGVDVGFENNNQITRAAVAVLSYPELELVEPAQSLPHERSKCFGYCPAPN